MHKQDWYDCPIQIYQPVARLEETNDPKEEINVEEEEEIGQQNRMLVTPIPHKGRKVAAAIAWRRNITLMFTTVAKEIVIEK